MYLMKKEAAADVPEASAVGDIHCWDCPAMVCSVWLGPEEDSALLLSLPPSVDVESG